MRARPHRRLVTLLLVATLAAACGPDPVVAEAPAPAPDESAVEASATPLDERDAPVAAPGEFDLPGTVPMAGTLVTGDDGCWRLQGEWDGALIVLPPGTEAGGSTRELLTADGVVLTDGQAVDADGALVATADLPGGPAGPWASYVDACAPASQAIAVVETLAPSEPAIDGSDEAALTQLLAATTFDTHWPCGHGFAVSGADQRVGLFVQPSTPQPPAPGIVTLPDDRFEVTVVLGRYLFVNHCDDVLEWFEPESERSATWPVTSGRFDYQPGDDTGLCTGSGPVTSELTGAAVTTPTGSLELPTIALRNDAFGCFAG